MKSILSLCMLCCAVLFLSCSDDTVDSQIEASKSTLLADADASVVNFTITANTDWAVDPPAKWYTVTPLSGKKGQSTITVSISANLTNELRRSSLLFTTKDKTAKVLIEQGKQLIFDLTASSFNVDNDGVVVAIVSDKKYQPTVPEGIDWVTFTEVGGVLKMTVARNTSVLDRLCKVSFKDKVSGEIKEVLIIQGNSAYESKVLLIKDMKIDGIPCVIDVASNFIYFPVDMQATPKLAHKIEFSGLGIDYIKIDDKKVMSGETVTFNQFQSKSHFTIKACNNLIAEPRTTALNITGLPIISITAPNGIVDAYKSPCDMEIIDPLARTDGNVYYKTHAGIEWRGSGALRYVKKAYGFKLWEDGTETAKDATILGLREDNNWILDAMWLDKARMRNRVCFDVWNEFNEPYYKKSGEEKKANTGTHGYMVEVFLDGKYHGLYVLSDKLDRKQLKLKKEGGYLYKLGDWTDECILHKDNDNPPNYNNNNLVWNGVEMDYPDEQGKVEFKYYSDLLNFVGKSSKEDFAAEFESRIDVGNMIDCFIFTNLIMAYDNLGRNTYWGIYDIKKSNKMVPLVWDMDGTLGRSWDRQQENPDGGWLVKNRHNNKSYRIYERMLNDNPADVHAKIKARWAEIKNGALSPANVNKKLEYYGSLQVNSGAQDREITRWSGSDQYDYSDVMAEVAYIKSWYAKRWAKMDALINGL